MAQLIDQAGMDVILVGDSASNVMAGNVTTLPITLDQMIYHGKSVMKAVKRALVVVDLPFGTYQKLKRSVGFGYPCDEGNACGLSSLKEVLKFGIYRTYSVCRYSCHGTSGIDASVY